MKTWFKNLWANASFKKIFLYLTGFFSGMSVMAIELGASRLMAPYFSSSQIVYTIIIGTVMIAMAIGNIIGGKMADKRSTPTKLFVLIFIAACWICLIPVVGKFVIAGVALGLAASSLSSNFLVWAAFLSCLLVFVFPLLILGMVTPSLIKYAVGDLKNNGRVVGTIEAFGTIGSIIGTFIPTFVTIPFLGTSWNFIIFSIILFLICLVYFFYAKKHRILFSVIDLFMITLAIFGSRSSISFMNENTIYEGESIYNYLRVEETNESFTLSTNVLFGVQSVKMKEDGLTGMYYDTALAANSMVKEKDEPLDILILGLGTGTFAYQTNYYYDSINGHANIEGVEIDSKIVSLARKYFDLPENVNVHINDGRAYMNSNKKKYDIIMVDAYQDITIPFQMSSIEFFRLVEKSLNPGGIMVVNMNMYTNNEGGINDYLSGTIKNVFNNVYTCKSNTNIELFACNDFDLKDELYNNIDKITDLDLMNKMMSIHSNLEYVSDDKAKYKLTDDKAQVELLGMDVLDDMIFEELNYYREKLKGKSIKEIIDMVNNGELF
ncbi:MAG: fused MFS/spermidine synthase [Acholeplasmatales bacterium]|nr:fused MFS/spermidine synthase [Acholeplasmatales bacterium]